MKKIIIKTIAITTTIIFTLIGLYLMGIIVGEAGGIIPGICKLGSYVGLNLYPYF